MAFPAAPTESGGAKLHFLSTDGNAAAGWLAVDTGTSGTGSNTLGFAAVATHVEGDAVGAPGGLATTSVPVVLVAGDDGTNAAPLQVDASAYLKVVLQAGTAAYGKLAANSGVDIGDVDVLSLPTLPAGTNAIGKLAANTGVDIGDVDVTSIVPGTAATSLGKAIDSAAGATDTGVAPLAIRDDTLSALTPVEGDWAPLRVNSTGALHVTGGGGGTQYAVDDALGATPTGTVAVAIRDDALSALTPVEGDAVGLRVDANGALWTHDDVLEAALSGSELQVDVVAALPAGTNAIGKLAANTGVDIGDVDVLSLPTLPAGTNAIGKLAANTGVDIGDVTINNAQDAPVFIAPRNDHDTTLYKFADINDATSGDNTIIAALGASKHIAVWAILIVSDGTVDVRWEDGAAGTAFTGQVPLQTREGYSISAGGLVPLFVGTANTLLNLELSAAINVHGFVSYSEIAT